MAKNIILSLAGWVMVQQVIFHALMNEGHMNSQLAKFLCSPIGVPVGMTIQWLVFGDRAKALWRSRGLRRALFGGGRKYTAARAGLFVLNQALYAMFLHKAGLSPGRANTAAAPIGSLASYPLLLWVTRLEQSKQEANSA